MSRIEMLIEDITIADRARKDLGDLRSLAASIEALGLLQPIGVTAAGALVFGHRRLEAFRSLGRTRIPVHVLANADDALLGLRAELDENLQRLPFTAVEAAALRTRIRELQAPVVALAQRDAAASARTPGGQFGAPAEDAAPVTDMATVDEEVAKATGFSVTTLKRVERLDALTADPEPVVARAAVDALTAIESGAPVKPALDRVLAEQAAVSAATRYPALALITGEPQHVVRMAAYLDEVQATGDEQALASEIQAITAMWGTDTGPQLPSARDQQTAFELNTLLTEATAKFDRAQAPELLARLRPALTPTTARTWTVIAQDLTRIADSILSAISDDKEPRP